jgi:hypothetical protein
LLRFRKGIGRKTVPKKLLAEAPVRMLAYDLLEWEGRTSANGRSRSGGKSLARH